MVGIKRASQLRFVGLSVLAVFAVAGCSATKPMSHSWKRLANNRDPVQVEPWNWTSTIPQGTPRAELVSTTIPGDSLAQWAPDLESGLIHLVSSHPASHCSIVNVDGRSITNFGELNTVLGDLQEIEDSVQVDYIGPNGQTAAFEVSVPELNRVAQAIAPNQPILRVSEESNSWVLLRDGSVRCKVTARVERTRGVLHLAVSLCNCDATQQQLLPIEIKATCDGNPLHCLNVSQTLDRLYRPNQKRDAFPEGQISFASMSEQDDYLIPTNYRQLESELQERKLVSAPVPALATIPGELYPGPALLGDARALTGFLLQRELFAPDESEKTGWVVFAGETLKSGEQIQVEIDLGNGTRQVELKVPRFN